MCFHINLISRKLMYHCIFFNPDIFIIKILIILFIQAQALASQKKALVAVLWHVVVGAIVNSMDIWMTDHSTESCNYLPQFQWFSYMGKGKNQNCKKSLKNQ